MTQLSGGRSAVVAETRRSDYTDTDTAMVNGAIPACHKTPAGSTREHCGLAILAL